MKTLPIFISGECSPDFIKYTDDTASMTDKERKLHFIVYLVVIESEKDGLFINGKKEASMAIKK